MAIDIGISEEDRKSIVDGLSRLLSDTYVLYLKTQGSNTFGNGVNCQRQFVILLFKHQVQCTKLRPCDVPMKVMGFQIEYIGI